MIDSVKLMEYNLNDIENIKNKNNYFTLDQATIDLINSISEKVGAPSYIKTPTFHKKREDKKKKNKKNIEINDEDWTAIRNFQATEKKKREGIEVLMDNIRCELNKISDKNYEPQKNRILELMGELMKSDYSENEKNSVVKLIFDIASSNKFYSKIYAQLYKDLSYFYSCLDSILSEHIDNYKKMFENIEYCDPEKDYEKYCKNNKQNDCRRALTSFIVNLSNLSIINMEVIYSMIVHLMDITREMLKNENQKNELCEITENMFILITLSKEQLKQWNDDSYDEIVDFVTNMKLLKVKLKPGLSNKTLFKYMDIYDSLQK